MKIVLSLNYTAATTVDSSEQNGSCLFRVLQWCVRFCIGGGKRALRRVRVFQAEWVPVIHL
jgi:hypothetical protein